MHKEKTTHTHFLAVFHRSLWRRITHGGLVLLMFAVFWLISSACAPFGRPARRVLGSPTVPSIVARATQVPTKRATPTETPVEISTPTLIPTSTPVAIKPDTARGIAPMHTLIGHMDDVTDVAFSPDVSLVASGSMDGTVRLWKVSDGSLLYVLEGHTDGIISIAFSPDGSLVASGSNDRTVRIWNVREGHLERTIESSFMGRVLRVAFSPDGALLAMADHQCYVQLRSTSSGILRRTLAQPKCVISQGGTVSTWGLAFSPDGSYLATGESRPCCGGSLHLWDVEETTSPQLLAGYNWRVRDLVYSPDGLRMAVAFEGSPVFWLVHAEDASLLRTFEGHTFRVNSVAFSPDGALLTSGSRDQKVNLWVVETGELLVSLEGHTDEVNRVAFSKDGTMLASGSDDDTVILWGVPAIPNR